MSSVELSEQRTRVSARMSKSPAADIFLRPQLSQHAHHTDAANLASPLELNKHTGVRDGDEGIVATNDDATLTKKAVVHLGYISDPLIQFFTADKSGLKKSPEIHRGYHVRVNAVWNLVLDFLRASRAAGFQSSQIVSVGCGFDTMYWRLKDKLKTLHPSESLVCSKFVELDLPAVVVRKAANIARHGELHSVLEHRTESLHSMPIAADDEASAAERQRVELAASASADEQANLINAGGDKKYFKALEDGSIWSSDYYLLSCDLRQAATFEHALLEVCKLDRNLPTLLIAECVLVYMKPEESDQIIQSFARNFNVAGIFVYDPVNLSDKFGETMISNLSRHGAALLGADTCDSMNSQIARLKACNFPQVLSKDMLSVYKTMSPIEKKRVESIEFLDETYLLEQLFQHYCLLFGLSIREEANFIDKMDRVRDVFSSIDLHM